QGQHDDRRAITRATATERQPQPESQDEYGGRGARPTEPASASGGPRQAARRYGDHRYDQCVGWNNTSSMGFVEPTTSRFASSTVGNITNAATPTNANRVDRSVRATERAMRTAAAAARMYTAGKAYTYQRGMCGQVDSMNSAGARPATATATNHTASAERLRHHSSHTASSTGKNRNAAPMFSS